MLGYSQEPTPTFGGLSMEETFLSYSEKMGKLNSFWIVGHQSTTQGLS